MTSLSPRENYLRCLRHEETEYVPFVALGPGGDAVFRGLFCPAERGQESAGFRDGFGVRWDSSESAPGGQIPAPGEFILKDITKWKKTITIPDVEQYDWQKLAEEENITMPMDPDKQASFFVSSNGVWERLATLMGFEEAMIALVEEPDACNDLFTAITDFKLRQAEKVAKYYKCDVFINFDDIATERNLFMSPSTYRALIKPHHKRLNDGIKNLGMIPVQHTCGHAELCVEDYIETGAAAWHSVQPSNDIAGILDKYGDRFSLEGGYDSTGKPGYPDATVEEVAAEVDRCFREYGSKKGFMFWPTILGSVKDFAEKNAAITERANTLRFAGR
jgi:uroporphyrinogen-III decarboxylase